MSYPEDFFFCSIDAIDMHLFRNTAGVNLGWLPAEQSLPAFSLDITASP
jgi:hypothetical protein